MIPDDRIIIRVIIRRPKLICYVDYKSYNDGEIGMSRFQWRGKMGDLKQTAPMGVAAGRGGREAGGRGWSGGRGPGGGRGGKGGGTAGR